MHDIRNSYGFNDEIEYLEGGITCIISAAYCSVLNIKKCENNMQVKTDKTKS